jgi:hypothetical protein
MPNWSEVIQEMQKELNNGNQNAIDTVRRKYLKKVSEITKKNTIVYY